MVATGNQQVLLLQSGADVGTLFTPTTNITSTFTSKNGSLADFVAPVQAINMTGGDALRQIGPIIAAEIVSDGTFSWLLVGGSFGLAVLANADGSGWPQGALTNGFAGLPTTMTWKLLTPWQQVRKIIADGDTVYVLTARNLMRFTASQTNFATTNSSLGTVIASAINLVGKLGTFSDMLVSGPLALLATSYGLFVSGVGSDVATASNEAAVGWQPFALPESPGPVTRLFPISPTEFATDFAKTDRGGNIYVLSAAVGAQQVGVYRLSIQGLPLSGGQVTQDTVSVFEDQYVEGQLSTYFYIGDYRNFVATDGASLFLSRSAYYPTLQSSYLQVAIPGLRTGVFNQGTKGQVFFSPVLQKDAFDVPVFVPSRMGPIVQRSATGSWMIAGSKILVQA